MKSLIVSIILLSFVMSVNCSAAKPFKVFAKGGQKKYYGENFGPLQNPTGGPLNQPFGGAGINVPFGGGNNNGGYPVQFSQANTQNGANTALQSIERMISGSNLNNNQKNYYRKLPRQAIRELAAAESQKMSTSEYKRKVH